MRLQAYEKRWSVVLGRTLLPVDAVGGYTAQVDLAGELDAYLAELPGPPVMLYRMALLIAWFAPLFVLGRLRTFGGLDEAARLTCLERLLASPFFVVRELMLLLKLNLCMVLMGSVEVLGYLKAYDVPPPRALAAAGTPVTSLKVMGQKP